MGSYYITSVTTYQRYNKNLKITRKLLKRSFATMASDLTDGQPFRRQRLRNVKSVILGVNYSGFTDLLNMIHLKCIVVLHSKLWKMK